MSVLNFVVAHFQEILNAVSGVLLGLIGVFMLIPGDQPEKAMQSVVDFISKFSLKQKP